MNEQEQSKIIPNSYTSPNYLVDVLMRYLSGNEQKCVDVLCRKTFGWQKRSDRISNSQMSEITGLNPETVDSCMAELVKYHVVVRKSESVANKGIEWAIELDDTKINIQELIKRYQNKRRSNERKTAKARQKIKGGLFNNPTLSNNPPGGLSNNLHKRHYQKTESSSSSATGEKLFNFYEKEISKVTPTIREKLTEARDTYTESLVIDAIKEAVQSSSKPNLNYILAILKRWKIDGSKTKTKGNQHANSKNQSGTSETKQPEYSAADIETAKRIKAKREQKQIQM